MSLRITRKFSADATIDDVDLDDDESVSRNYYAPRASLEGFPVSGHGGGGKWSVMHADQGPFAASGGQWDFALASSGAADVDLKQLGMRARFDDGYGVGFFTGAVAYLTDSRYKPLTNRLQVEASIIPSGKVGGSQLVPEKDISLFCKGSGPTAGDGVVLSVTHNQISLRRIVGSNETEFGAYVPAAGSELPLDYYSRLALRVEENTATAYVNGVQVLQASTDLSGLTGSAVGFRFGYHVNRDKAVPPIVAGLRDFTVTRLPQS